MFDKLQEKYKNSLPEKIYKIESLLKDFKSNELGAEEKIKTLAHSLHGSGSTYGFPEISQAAREVEHADDRDFLEKINCLIIKLQQVSSNKLPDSNKHREILIIEDDSDISNLLELILSDKFDDYRISIAETAEKAREYLKRSKYSLILLDLVLPDGDGRTLLHQIRHIDNLSTPVFVFSGMDNRLIQEQCIEQGADRFIGKPFDPELVLDTISQFLTSQREQSEPISEAPEIFQEPENTQKDASSISTVSGSILLAEDDELLADIIVHRLSREGLKVEHVRTGEAAISALQKNQYCLIILDVKMPIFDGFEVLHRVRNNPNFQNIPVIMLTAMGSEKDIVRGYDLGASDYILKPFSPPELIARVKSLLK